MNESEEQAYMQGQRAVYLELLSTALRGLGYDGQEATANRWILEREQAVAQLRMVCRDFGDMEWDEDLHLADVIDKHLGRWLHEAVSRGEPLTLNDE